MTLEHLDTVLAFAAIMAGVSLFITTLTQMASGVLGLRGHNLRLGLQTLLENLDPALEEHAAAISEEVLLHPLVSDSMFARRTALLLNLPGVRLVLKWPRAAAVVKRWRLSTVIRPEEMMDILKRLASGLPQDAAWRTELLVTAATCKKLSAAAPEVIEAVNRLAKQLPENSSWRAMAESPATFLGEMAGKIRLAEALKRTEAEAAFRAAAISAEMKQMLGGLHPQDVPATVRQLFPHLAAKAGQTASDLERWFDSTMVRVSQRFTMHMRVWTVVFSVIVAAGLQLDALELLRRLASDAELRARLVSGAETLTRKADDILTASGSTNPPAEVCLEAMRQVRAGHPKELGSLPAPAGFTTISGGETWFCDQLARHNPTAATNTTQVNAWLGEFRNQVPQAGLRAAADQLHSLVKDGLSLQLVPDPYPTSISEFWAAFARHWQGILASAAFLSLGAPFWFSLLKSLSNLRPALATKQDQEAKAAAKA